eukprot:2684096-Rhodomonas_salina.2
MMFIAILFTFATIPTLTSCTTSHDNSIMIDILETTSGLRSQTQGCDAAKQDSDLQLLGALDTPPGPGSFGDRRFGSLCMPHARQTSETTCNHSRSRTLRSCQRT